MGGERPQNTRARLCRRPVSDGCAGEKLRAVCDGTDSGSGKLRSSRRGFTQHAFLTEPLFKYPPEWLTLLWNRLRRKILTSSGNLMPTPVYNHEYFLSCESYARLRLAPRPHSERRRKDRGRIISSYGVHGTSRFLPDDTWNRLRSQRVGYRRELKSQGLTSGGSCSRPTASGTNRLDTETRFLQRVWNTAAVIGLVPRRTFDVITHSFELRMFLRRRPVPGAWCARRLEPAIENLFERFSTPTERG